MGYKNVLVHVKTNEEWSPHIDYGFGIASHFAARIVGMAIFDDMRFCGNMPGSAMKEWSSAR